MTTTCHTCTRWHEVPERLQVICDRCGMPLLVVSEREPVVTDDGTVWVGIERTEAWRQLRPDGFVSDHSRSWSGVERVEEYRGVELHELSIERQRTVLLRVVYDRAVRVLEELMRRSRVVEKNPLATWYGWRDRCGVEAGAPLFDAMVRWRTKEEAVRTEEADVVVRSGGVGVFIGGT